MKLFKELLRINNNKMPNKTINDYFFYKIICLDDSVELCYVGSTANFNKRRQKHKYNCNNETSKNYNLKIYTTIRENGGWDNFKMIEIGKTEQLTKREAEQVEEQYRQELRANMNMKKCYLTEEDKLEYKKQYNLDNRDKIKQYYEDNRDKKLEYNKQYNQDNRDKIAEQKKQYYEDNRDKKLELQKQYNLDNCDKIKERTKQYREDNRDKIKQYKGEKITCECGCEIRRDSLSRHRKSKTHQDLMSTKY